MDYQIKSRLTQSYAYFLGQVVASLLAITIILISSAFAENTSRPQNIAAFCTVLAVATILLRRIK